MNGAKWFNKRTYITKADRQKQAKPIEKCSRNVGQKFLRSKINFSEMRVTAPESNSVFHPDGRDFLKEKDEVPCGKQKHLHKKSQDQPVKLDLYQSIAYLEISLDE